MKTSVYRAAMVAVFFALLMALLAFNSARAEEPTEAIDYQISSWPNWAEIYIRNCTPGQQYYVDFGDGTAPTLSNPCIEGGYSAYASHFYKYDFKPVVYQANIAGHIIPIEVGNQGQGELEPSYQLDPTTPGRVLFNANNCTIGLGIPIDFGDPRHDGSYQHYMWACGWPSYSAQSANVYPVLPETVVYSAKIGGTTFPVVIPGSNAVVNDIYINWESNLPEDINDITIYAEPCVLGTDYFVDFGDGSNTWSTCGEEGLYGPYPPSVKVKHSFPYSGQVVTYTLTVDGYSEQIVIPGEPTPDEEEVLPFLLKVEKVEGSLNSFMFQISRAEPWTYVPVKFGDGSNTDAEIIDGVANVLHDYPINGTSQFTYTVGWEDDIHYTGVITLDLGGEPEPPQGNPFSFQLEQITTPNRYSFNISDAEEYEYIRVEFGDGVFTDALILQDGTASVPYDYPVTPEGGEYHWTVGDPDSNHHFSGVITIEPQGQEPPPPLTPNYEVVIYQDSELINRVVFDVRGCIPNTYFPVNFGDGSGTDALCLTDGTAQILHDYPYNGEPAEFFWQIGTGDEAVLGVLLIGTPEVKLFTYLPLIGR